MAKRDGPSTEASTEACKRRRATDDDDTEEDEEEEEVVSVGNREDLYYIIGKGMSALRKVAKVSGADLELLGESPEIAVIGNARQRRDAKRFLRFFGEMRTGTVHVSETDLQDSGILLRVPADSIAIVLGRGGKFLRTTEDKWNVVMFQATHTGSAIIGGSPRDLRSELIAIFGKTHGRRGAQLDVMSVVEVNAKGYYTHRSQTEGEAYDDHYRGGDLGTSMTTLPDSDIALAIGKKGLTKKKLASSSETILQIVGNVLFVSGTRSRRARAKEYVKLLFDQMQGPVDVDLEGRDDVTPYDVPRDIVDVVSGEHHRNLISLEDAWGVFMFFAAETEEDRDGMTRRLLIFGPERSRTGVELQFLHQLEHLKPGFLPRGVKEKVSSFDGFDTERLVLKPRLIAHVVGPDKLTMKRLQEASGAIFQKVADVFWIAGDGRERKTCREYLTWHLHAEQAEKIEIDARGRDDITEIDVPPGAKQYVTGKAGAELRRISSESGTFCIWARDHNGVERLCILGRNEGDELSAKGRVKAEIMVTDMIEDKLDMDAEGRMDALPSRRCRIPSPPPPTRRPVSWET